MPPPTAGPVDPLLLAGIAGLGVVAVVLLWKLTKAIVRIVLILIALAALATLAGWLWLQGTPPPPRSLPDQMRHQPSAMRMGPVLPEVDPLPRSQDRRPGRHRDGKIDRRQGRADMGRHVVVTLRRMHV